MKRETSNFIVAVVVIYGLAFAAVAARGATTNDYTYTGPGLTGLNPALPLPTEWMSDSGAQALRQLKAALLNFSTNAATGQHNLDGSHKTDFIAPAMIPAGAIERRHFESNVTAQLIGSNGFAQLPLSDVFIQWAWWTNSSKTSTTWSVTWPTLFSNGVWFAKATAHAADSNWLENVGSPSSWSSNEWATASEAGWSSSNVFGTLRVSGAYSTQWLHRVSVIGVGRK
jgi:hypothetical protein